MLKWYVVQTKPRKESDVVRQLGNARLETLNPKIRSFASGFKPLFPNYVFLRWNLTDAKNYHMIRYTRGVNKVLGTREFPVPVADEVIEVIKERLSPTSVLEHEIMKVGSHVKVRKGLLKDLIGVLEKPVSADGRVAVLLKIHERYMKAAFHCRDVAPVSLNYSQ